MQTAGNAVEAYKGKKVCGTHSENRGVYEVRDVPGHKIRCNKFSEVSKQNTYKL